MNHTLPDPEKLAYRIDRDAFEPAYLQLAKILRRQIAEGLFRPGDQLPSESQLCNRYNISPMTVRRTINLLADQGVVNTAQGRGTFVAALEMDTAVFDLHGLYSLFSQGEGSVRLLDVRVVSADLRTARKLDIPAGSSTIYLRRLFLHQEKPIFYHRAYLVYDPTRPIVEAEMDVTSLQGLFSGMDNSLLKKGQLAIEATLMNNEEAQLLQKSTPCAAFYLEHLFFDFNDKPLSWGWFIIPPDILQLQTVVGIQDETPSTKA